jgi:hypothetical protein
MEAIEQKAQEALAMSRLPREREVCACARSATQAGIPLELEFSFNSRRPARNTPFSRALHAVAGSGSIFMNALVFYSAPLAQWLERWSYEP